MRPKLFSLPAQGAYYNNSWSLNWIVKGWIWGWLCGVFGPTSIMHWNVRAGNTNCMLWTCGLYEHKLLLYNNMAGDMKGMAEWYQAVLYRTVSSSLYFFHPSVGSILCLLYSTNRITARVMSKTGVLWASMSCVSRILLLSKGSVTNLDVQYIEVTVWVLTVRVPVNGAIPQIILGSMGFKIWRLLQKWVA